MINTPAALPRGEGGEAQYMPSWVTVHDPAVVCTVTLVMPQPCLRPPTQVPLNWHTLTAPPAAPLLPRFR
jgi:hypothetical protein